MAKKKEKEGKAPVRPAERPPIKLLEEALAKVPAEKLNEARRRVEELIKGEMTWAALFTLPPEKLNEMAQVGYEQFQSGRYDRVEKIFKGLTVIDPENSYYHQLLGATFQRQERHPEAILEYSIAADLNPKDVVAITNRGECYVKLGIFPLAGKDFDKAISLDQTGSDRWANRARMLKDQMKLRTQKGG